MKYKKLFMQNLFLLTSLTLCKTSFALNILVITWDFPEPFHTYVLDDIIGLINRGHKVHIFATRKKNNSVLSQPKYSKYNLLKQVTYQNSRQGFARLFKRKRFDIIFVEFGVHAQKALEVKKKYFPRAKVAVTFRGWDMIKFAQLDPRLHRSVFKRVNIFLPVSQTFAQNLLRLGCPPDKIKIFYTSVDTNLFQPKKEWGIQEGKPIFISVGRLAVEKGYSYSIKAFAKIIEKYPEAVYYIIGEGKKKEDLRKLIKKLNLENNVYLLGSKPHSEIATWLNQADIFVIPSITGPQGQVEGIPVALQEAMFTALPCIGTHHTGIPELIKNGITGLLVEEKNIDQLSQAMEQLIEYDDLRSQLALEGERLVHERFTRQLQDDFLSQTCQNLKKNTTT